MQHRLFNVKLSHRVLLLVSLLVLGGLAGDRLVQAESTPSPSKPSPTPIGELGPPITTESGRAERLLAIHLKAIGAKMYGAFWCPHCHAQKQAFGLQAVKSIRYIECDPRGQNAQPALCKAAKIRGYPTWEIKGKQLVGSQSLKTLADASGYKGPRDFQNNGGEPE